MKSYKVFKVILMLMIILSMIMTGCKTSDNETSLEKPNIEVSGYLEGIPIFLIFPEGNRPQDEEISEWENYILDKHELDIDLQYVDYIINLDNASENIDDKFGIDIDFFKELEKKDGFIKIMESGDIDKLVKNDLLISLNDFIALVPVISTMDDEVLSRFRDSDGNIWAFPDSGNISMLHRVYNKKWLDDSGFEVPQDIWSFLEYARYIAAGDPDENGEDDTYIQEYDARGIPFAFGDVFSAFGCYFNSFNLPVAYNPLIGVYENVAENENFKNALGFILKMMKEGLIRDNSRDYMTAIGKPEIEYMYGSLRTTIGVPEDFDGWEFGSCMSGDNKIALSLVTGTRTGFAVLKDTNSIVDIMNAIIASTNSIQGHCDFYYGREGYNYTIDGKRINLKYLYENYEVRMPIRFMTGYFNIHENGYYEILDNREVSDEYLKENSRFYENMKNYEASLLGTNLVYNIPFGADSSEILALNLALMEEFEELFKSIFKEDADIDEAIDSFLAVCIKLDSDAIISISNVALND
ncbi:MAG: hypothetical protein KAH14_08030 [Clostridiales bacterium]|nr:hypothetical protein [Clostridiales bacterium]